MTTLALNSEAPRENGNGSGWRTTLLGALFVAFMAVVGWIATDAQTSRSEMAAQLSAQGQRIAILEESIRNMRESQLRLERSAERIEDSVNELRRERRTR